MLTSARNQFHGTVQARTPGAVHDEIAVLLPGGTTVVALVTHESAMRLRLDPGMPAFALVPASAVLLATGPEQARRGVSVRNQLAGTVARITPGPVQTEVVVDVGAGRQVVAVVTRASASALGLHEGGSATVLFDASDVMLGTVA